MPKIHAKSLAEQREWRRSQLIEIATQIALTAGAKSLTVSELSKRAGISRTAIYEYFDSTADLVAELVNQELINYANLLSDACAAESSAMDKIEAWVRAGLNYIADGRHILVKTLNATSFPESRSRDIALSHRKMLAPLRDSLMTLGVADDSVMEYIKAISDAAAIRIEQGYPADLEIESACQFLSAGIRALAIKSIS